MQFEKRRLLPTAHGHRRREKTLQLLLQPSAAPFLRHLQKRHKHASDTSVTGKNEHSYFDYDTKPARKLLRRLP
jgi:hypothetical protein